MTVIRDITSGLGLRSGRRRFRNGGLAAFGLSWLAVEPAGLFWPDRFDWGWPGYVGLVLLSVATGCLHARTPKGIARSLPPTNVRVEIKVGDVLAQEGNVVIGASDSFDTTFDSGIIGPTSVQGQFLTRAFGGDAQRLDAAIANSIGSGAPAPLKTFGKRERFPIGTVAVVESGPRRYFLPAFTKMSDELPAHVTSSPENLQVALAKTWEVVHRAGQTEPVHMPVIGSKHARLGLSMTLVIQLIVLSFVAATRSGAPDHLTVWIRESDRSHIDLNEIDEWLAGLCAA